MNICFVCNEYPPYKSGGIGIFTKEIAETLVKENHNVFVVGIYTDIEEEKEINGVKVFRIKGERGKFAFYKNSRKLGKFIKNLQKENKLDIIEVPDFEGVNAFWPKFDIPIIMRLHGTVTYFAREMKQKESKLTFFIEKRALNRADFIVSVSRYTAFKTKTIFNLKREINVIYNGIKIPNNEKCKNSFENSYIVGFSGSLMRKKGVLSLAKAWNIVLEEFPQAKLRLIGKDTFENGVSIKKKIESIIKNENSVEFIGHVKKEKMEKLLTECDLAIYPSYAEAFSLAPLEAMALKLPVIYSNRTSGPELKEKISSLEIVDPDKIEEIAGKIKNMLMLSANERKNVGIKNRKNIKEYFDIEEKIEENLNFFKRCINE